MTTVYELFERLMLVFFTPKCYQDVVLNLNLFSNIDCLKYTLSKCLGYGVLGGSLMVRVPQILVILKASSVDGISFISELLMLIAVCGTMSYGYFMNYPISTYGDSYSLYVQGAIIILLMCYYKRNYLHLILLLSALVAYPLCLVNGLVHVNVIYGLNATQMGLTICSKLIQAFANYRNSSTGKLSAITLLLQFAGCIARIFTSAQETGDLSMIVTYTLGAVTNGILVAQLFYYWNSSVATEKKKKTIKKKTN